ncbi:VG15 protein [Streptomyces liangshanensis]|uniref:VG15 protein n=1 Tax=Streptomyces liangshanensis TaxID=2717324 RepID=UPI0036DB82ED
MGTPVEERRLTAEELAQAYYVTQAQHSRRTADRVQALWRELDRRDLTGSWESFVGPRIVAAVTAGQLAAAAGADEYTAAVVAADGATSDPSGRIRPAAFAGVAADGRALESLLYLPVITSKQALAAGLDDVEAMMRGLHQLLRMAASEVADAGRGATGTAITANRTIRGYIRVVNPPACGRCIILAGLEYGWNAGFQRHPRCDCVHMPSTLIARGRHHRGAFDPKAYFDSLSEREQARIFTQAGAQAIRDGASMTSVINARRGMYTADAYGQRVRATRDSTTRRGSFYRQERRRAIQRGLIPNSGRGFRLVAPRLLPEEIYRLAGNDRGQAIAMLRRFGYLT